MRRLLTATQGYAWGKRGRESRVSQLKMSEGEGFEVDEDKTYAELWMGTHPNGPSRVMPEPGDFVEGAEEGHAGIFLIELLETHPHYLGDLQEQGDLPFMFKVLSINKALSIQVRGWGWKRKQKSIVLSSTSMLDVHVTRSLSGLFLGFVFL